jgi:hypothetical protein
MKTQTRDSAGDGDGFQRGPSSGVGVETWTGCARCVWGLFARVLDLEQDNPIFSRLHDASLTAVEKCAADFLATRRQTLWAERRCPEQFI